MNAVTVLENDIDVKTLLVRHGKAAHVVPRPNFGPFRYQTVWSDEEGYYAVTHYHGFDDPCDNGYTAIILTRALTTPEVAMLIIGAFINQNRHPGPAYSEIHTEKIEAN